MTFLIVLNNKEPDFSYGVVFVIIEELTTCVAIKCNFHRYLEKNHFESSKWTQRLTTLHNLFLIIPYSPRLSHF
jgi:hypothetical protein